MKRLLVLLLPCLLLAGQKGIEPVTITDADGKPQTYFRINTGDGYLDPKPVNRQDPPNAPADTGVLWVDRIHRYGIVQATEVSGDGMHVLANWYLNDPRATYYRTLGNEVPVWESPGDFAFGSNGRQIGSSYDARVLTLSKADAAVKWSRTSGYPDWTYDYPSQATGFTKASRDGAKVIAAQNGTQLMKLVRVAMDTCKECEDECRKHEKHKQCKDCADACADCYKQCKQLGA